MALFIGQLCMDSTADHKNIVQFSQSNFIASESFKKEKRTKKENSLGWTVSNGRPLTCKKYFSSCIFAKNVLCRTKKIFLPVIENYLILKFPLSASDFSKFSSPWVVKPCPLRETMQCKVLLRSGQFF